MLVAHGLLRAALPLVPALGTFAIQRQRHECRCGTQECVRHFSPLYFQRLAGRFVESVAAARTSAYATSKSE